MECGFGTTHLVPTHAWNREGLKRDVNRGRLIPTL